MAKRPYAKSQRSHPVGLNLMPSVWRNRLAVNCTVNDTVSWLLGGLDSVSDLLFSYSLINEVKSKRPDLIYSFPHTFDRYSPKVAEKLGVPLVIEMWEDYAQFGLETMIAMGFPPRSIMQKTKRAYSWMANISARADRVIVPSTVFLEKLCQLGIPKNKIRIVPVCVRPTPVSDPSLMRRKHKIKPDELLVFHIGNKSPWHDLDTLIQSLKYIKSKARVVISGGRPERPSLGGDSQTLQPLFTGKVTSAELGGYLSASDICVAPYSFTKPSGFFPAKIIRYMLAGKAIVATDLPEIREMFKGKPAGILVPPRNPKALSEALDYLAENEAARLRMGAMAREIAEDNYLTRHHTNHLLRIFAEVL